MIWYFLVILTLGLCTAVVAVILPKLTLSTHISSVGTTDVGIKKVREPNGCAVVYVPSGAVGRYIYQYILAKRNGKAVLLCKLSPKIHFMSYDVIVFDAMNNVLEVKHVEELISNRGFTQELPLPEDTSYVQILLHTVNNKNMRVSQKGSIPLTNAILYAVFTALVSLVEIIFLRFCIIKIVAGIFYESFVTSGSDTLVGVLVAIAVCLVNVGVSVFVLTFGGKRNKQ